jgi:hypothetical protein
MENENDRTQILQIDLATEVTEHKPEFTERLNRNAPTGILPHRLAFCGFPNRFFARAVGVPPDANGPPPVPPGGPKFYSFRFSCHRDFPFPGSNASAPSPRWRCWACVVGLPVLARWLPVDAVGRRPGGAVAAPAFLHDLLCHVCDLPGGGRGAAAAGPRQSPGRDRPHRRLGALAGDHRRPDPPGHLVRLRHPGRAKGPGLPDRRHRLPVVVEVRIPQRAGEAGADAAKCRSPPPTSSSFPRAGPCISSCAPWMSSTASGCRSSRARWT